MGAFNNNVEKILEFLKEVKMLSIRGNGKEHDKQSKFTFLRSWTIRMEESFLRTTIIGLFQLLVLGWINLFSSIFSISFSSPFSTLIGIGYCLVKVG